MRKRILFYIFPVLALFIVLFVYFEDADRICSHCNRLTGGRLYCYSYSAHPYLNGRYPYKLGGSNDTPVATSITSNSSRLDLERIDEEISQREYYFKTWNSGYEAGIAEGRKERYEERYNEGYEKGFEEGMQSEHDAAVAKYDQKVRTLIRTLIASVAVMLALMSLCVSTKKSVRRLKEENQNLLQRIRYVNGCSIQRNSPAKPCRKKTARSYAHRMSPLSSPAHNTVKTFGKWTPEVHASEKQFHKFLRANQESLAILERDENSALIVGKSGRVYTTSLNQCSCPDFNLNEQGKAPCKHIYFLAMQLGIPVKDIFEEYIQP